MSNNAIDLGTIRRVLVIKLRHHGDVLLSSPVFNVLKNHAPHLEIDALVYHDTVDMLSLHPAIRQVYSIDQNWKSLGILQRAQNEWRLLSALRARHYDLVIHLTEHPRGAWLKYLIGAPYGVARKLTDKKGWFWKNSFTHYYPWLFGNRRHTVELHLDALRRIGIQPSENEKRLTLIAGEAAEARVAALLTQHGLCGKDFIHIHPTSRWLFKCWSEKNVSRLIKTLQERGHTVVLSAAPDSEELAMVERILAPLATPPVNLAGQLSLKELAALTRQARCFVGVDSAPMHIAAAMQTPVVALFGPSGDKEWGPWHTPHQTLTSDYPCRPCGQDGCGGGKISECLTTIPVERVLDAIDTLLQTA
jgi:heptosyltransferase-3